MTMFNTLSISTLQAAYARAVYMVVPTLPLGAQSCLHRPLPRCPRWCPGDLNFFSSAVVAHLVGHARSKVLDAHRLGHVVDALGILRPAFRFFQLDPISPLQEGVELICSSVAMLIPSSYALKALVP
eukprot:1393451-Amorphochlora_amoeboformis.AAC.1